MLQKWELSAKEAAKQALEAADELAEDAPAVEAMLRAVGNRIESGTWRTTGWSIFEVLGIVRREDSHTDLLAWLFRPWEAHGLGVRFLQEFVFAASGKSLPNTKVYASVARKKLSSDAGVIDIEVQGDGWLLAVENKIDAHESPGRYNAICEALSPA